jgi:hypothetical protein
VTAEDDDDEAYAQMIAQAWAEAMPEVRANAARTRATIAAFFGVAVEHLPNEGTVGWLRLIYTYVYGRRLKTDPTAAHELSLALSDALFAKEPPS